jgi:class 3 adenylate cyclase
MSETRKIAAILAADVVGYSRLAGADEDRTLARLRALRSDLIDPTIAVHHGRVFKRTGDGALVEFRSVVDAVRCAIEVQNGMVERNAGPPRDRRIDFRIGIHLGDVVEETDGDLMGDGVNIAARLDRRKRRQALGHRREDRRSPQPRARGASGAVRRTPNSGGSAHLSRPRRARGVQRHQGVRDHEAGRACGRPPACSQGADPRRRRPHRRQRLAS